MTKRGIILSFVSVALLAIWLTDCVTKAHAQIEPVWIPLLGTDTLKVRSLHSDGERLYADTKNGFYISDDDGSTWRPTGMTHRVYCLGFGGDAVYAYTGMDFGMFRSDDRGETWKPINNGLPLMFWEDGDSYYPWFRDIYVAGDGTVMLGTNGLLFTSTDRGETWRDVTQEWLWENKTPVAAFGAESLTEFDGYLWVGELGAMRSPDRGQTWEYTGSVEGARFPFEWAVWDNRLYAVGVQGIARWNEIERRWEDLRAGLPPKVIVLAPPDFYTLRIIVRSDEYGLASFAVNRGRFFAGLRDEGVYMFDHRTETWTHAGLKGLRVRSLVSHRSDLYAATGEGIFRAAIPSAVGPYGKRVTTWGAIKTN